MTRKGEDALELKFHRAVRAHFPADAISASEICVAASGVMAAYLAALPNPESRAALLSRVILSLKQELEETGPASLQ